jgi:rhodanese-related sulfurtransferase
MSEPLNREAWLDVLREKISEITPAQALARQAQGALLIDVREDAERVSGMPANALGLSRGFLELRIEQVEADRGRPMVLLCGSGQRSLLAAEALLRMGYRQVSSVAGGLGRWKLEGLPISMATLDTDAIERYACRRLARQGRLRWVPQRWYCSVPAVSVRQQRYIWRRRASVS